MEQLATIGSQNASRGSWSASREMGSSGRSTDFSWTFAELYDN